LNTTKEFPSSGLSLLLVREVPSKLLEVVATGATDSGFWSDDGRTAMGEAVDSNAVDEVVI
jgi:hypothetical protein